MIYMFPGGREVNMALLFQDAATTREKEIRDSSSFIDNYDEVEVHWINSIEPFDPENPSVPIENADKTVDDVLIVPEDIINKAGLKAIINEEKIYQLDIFSHGTPKRLTVGSADDPYKREHLYKEDLEGFHRDAFTEGSTINMFGCNAANEPGSFAKHILREETIADSFAKHFKGTAVTGHIGGSMAVPYPGAKTNIHYKHTLEHSVWYNSLGGSKTYKYPND